MRAVIVDCAIYRDGRRTDGPADFSDALDEARATGDAFLWIGLHEPTEKEFDLVSSEFGLHPLAVEDALSAHQRPKLEVYDDSSSWSSSRWCTSRRATRSAPTS